MVANQNLNWVYFILEGLGMENVAIFFGQLEYFTAVRHILKPFGTFCGHLVHFVVIWYILWSFGTFCGHLVHFVVIWYSFPILVHCTKKHLATPVLQEQNETICMLMSVALAIWTLIIVGRRGPKNVAHIRVARWHKFSNQKYRFGNFLESLAKDNVGILYGHLVLAVWYFPPLWYVAPRIIWQH
jgi:hypothetical protein